MFSCINVYLYLLPGEKKFSFAAEDVLFIKDFDLKPGQSNLTLVVHKIMKMITSQFDYFLSLQGLLNLKLHEEG